MDIIIQIFFKNGTILKEKFIFILQIDNNCVLLPTFLIL